MFWSNKMIVLFKNGILILEDQFWLKIMLLLSGLIIRLFKTTEASSKLSFCTFAFNRFWLIIKTTCLTILLRAQAQSWPTTDKNFQLLMTSNFNLQTSIWPAVLPNNCQQKSLTSSIWKESLSNFRPKNRKLGLKVQKCLREFGLG